MKRILTYLILSASILAGCPLTTYAQKEKERSSKRQMETSDGPQTVSGHKFVIDGRVALDVKDATYNIYMTDIDKQITEADLVKSVTVDNKRFRFETELTTMKVGRLRAVMPDGRLSAAWVNIYFIPGFTVGLSIQNGAFDIDNDSEYEFMVNAWLNKDSLAVLIESMGLNVNSGNSTENQETKQAIKYYSDMLLKLEQEINYLNSNVRNSGPLIMKNLERMDSINTKMKSIIDRYADSIKY